MEWTLGYVLAEVDFSESAMNLSEEQLSAEQAFEDAAEQSRKVILQYAEIANRMIVSLEKAAKDALDGLSYLSMHYQSVTKKLLGN